MGQDQRAPRRFGCVALGGARALWRWWGSQLCHHSLYGLEGLQVGGLVGVVDGGTVGESVLVGASVPGTSVDGGTVGRFEGLQVGV